MACLALFEASLFLFRRFYWGHGLIRLGLLAAMLAFVLAIRQSGMMRPVPARRPRRSMLRPPGPAWLPALLLLSFVAVVSLAGDFPWGHGVVRVGMAALVGAFALALWRAGRAARRLREGRVWQHLAAMVLVLLALQSVQTIVWAMAAATRTDRMRLDEGRTTWRAVQALRRGEDPYGSGVLIDSTAFRHRLAIREALGVGPHLPAAAVEPALQRYLARPDPRLRRLLLPRPAAGASLAARREVALMGYKYGPPPLLVTAALAPLVGSAAVPLADGLACLGLFAAVGLALLAAGSGAGGAIVAVVALMLDPFISYFFLSYTATDVWPLAFGFAALACALRRNDIGFGAALALAASSKIMPGALFLLLLPVTRSWRAVRACAITSTALFLPFVLWDPWGLLNNFVLWGALMKPDTDSWVFGAPTDLVLAARIVLAAGLGWLGLRLVLRRERQVCVAFAVITLLLLGGGAAFHNNYVPWFSIWVVLAIAETWAIPGAISARLLARPPAGAIAGPS